MTITNKKLIRSFKSILSSSIAAKEIVLSEIEKVDEKYRKLAETEKSDLNDQLKVLESQISLYSSFFDEEDNTQEEANVDLPKPVEPEAEPEKVVDTIYDDNNIEEEVTEEVTEEVEKAAEEDDPFKEVTESTWEEAFGENMAKEDDTEVAEEAKSENEDDDDINSEWPQPTEW